jgi:cellulose synthase operon protein B
VFKENPLPLPLGFLRPGLNRIEIQAHVPTDRDASCDPLSAINARKRFLLLDSTEIELPAIARVARMPDLAVTATGGFPYADSAKRPKLYLPSFDRKSVGAAATMVAHLAIAAARPIDFQITASPPTQGPTLAVAPLASFDSSLLEKLGLPVPELQRAWKNKAEARAPPNDEASFSDREIAERNLMVLQKNFPMACHPPKVSRGSQSASVGVDDTPIGATGPDRDLFSEWDANLSRESRWASFVNWAERAARWTRSKFTDAATWVRTELDSTPDAAFASPHSLLAIGQNILGENSEDVWTIVTSPTADTLVDSVGCLVDPRVARQIAGRVSVLDMSRAKIEVSPVADSRFVMTQGFSVGNARLIAAGWLSLHATVYVAAAMTIALLLAVVTRWFVRHVGRRT